MSVCTVVAKLTRRTSSTVLPAYSVNPLELMAHFPFWPTLDNVCRVVGHIFNLRFEVYGRSAGLLRWVFSL